MARLKEEVEHSKRIIHELRSELHTITLRAQTTTESTGRLDAKVVQLNHELDHERALVNRLKDEQLDKSTSLTKLQSTVHTLEAERDMLHVRITGLVSATDQVSERRILEQFNHSTCCTS